MTRAMSPSRTFSPSTIDSSRKRIETGEGSADTVPAASAISRIGNARYRSILSSELVCQLQHVIRSLDGLGGDFVRALRDDHVHHFLDQFHVGGFQGTLDDGTEP